MAGVLSRVGVCGAGAMGSGIAQIAAQNEAEVIIFDVAASALEKSRAGIAKSLTGLADKGKISRDEADGILARLRWSDDLSAMADRELVIEAIIEDAGIKAQLFAQLEAIVAPGAVMASNTSSLPIARLARGLVHPGRFLGMHFFNPPTVMKLVEVIAGPATDTAVAESVIATAKAWGKVSIPVADVPGFIVNRVARPFYAEAFTALAEQAARPEEIDALFRAVGFRMGPLELTDLIGQDVNFAVARSVYDGYFGQTRFVPQLRQAALVDAGWLGRKSGRGVYDYAGTPAAAPQVVPVEPVAGSQKLADGLASILSGDTLEIAGAAVRLTRGLSARKEATQAGRPVLLLDYCKSGDGPVGYTASDEGTDKLARSSLALLGRPAVRLADRPGLVVSRTLAQIANAAADAVFDHVADEAGIDAALRFGANYPFGPFAFVDTIGRDRLVAILANIAGSTGQPMYHPSQYWAA